jgi:ribosomal protein S18 acetylase RimI-like enzyme
LFSFAVQFFSTLSQQNVVAWPSYAVWYSWWRSDAILAYLATLFEYFNQRAQQWSAHSSAFMQELVHIKRARLTDFQRIQLNGLADSTVPLCQLELVDHVDVAAASSYTLPTRTNVASSSSSAADAASTIPSVSAHILEVDFAHHDISFGRGGTQEELLLGMSPETHILPFLLESVQPNESVSVRGAQRLGTYDGYGCDVKYSGPFKLHEAENPTLSSQRSIVAMDASNMWSLLGELSDEEFDTPRTVLRLLHAQCDEEVLRRDLTKAFVAFDASSVTAESAKIKPEVHIRRATAADYSVVGDLTLAAYSSFLHGPDDPYAQSLLDAGKRDREAELWVAELKQSNENTASRGDGPVAIAAEVVGAVTICPPGSPWRELARDGQSEFRMLVVTPRAQGCGVGNALVQFCLNRAREEGSNAVVISTRPTMQSAHRLYIRAGFSRAADMDWSPRPGVDLLCFKADLTALHTLLSPSPTPSPNVLVTDPRVIWTGAWGCNSFGGNVHVKLLLQWIAASMARVSLIRFQTVQQHNDTLAQLRTHLLSARMDTDSLRQNPISIGHVWRCILKWSERMRGLPLPPQHIPTSRQTPVNVVALGNELIDSIFNSV